MDQALALNLLKSGHSCFVTGAAGTGKSYTIKKFIDYLMRKKITYAVTASTGIAASVFGGVTIHSWSGIGVREELTEEDLEKIAAKKTQIKDTGVLIVDEISMLHARQLVLVDQVLKYCRKSSLPFGGIQLVLVGDFFQLPPVDRDGVLDKDKFCFMSKAWVDANLKVCYLDKQYRQKKDVLTSILNEIRNNSLSEESIEIIKSTAKNEFESGVITKLYTHNIDVDRINQKELNSIDEKSYSHQVEKTGIASLCDMIASQNRIPDEFEYKIGAFVMFSKNNEESGYFNGTTGVIVGVNKSDLGLLPVVKVNGSGKEIIVEPQTWSIMDGGGEAIASVIQLPLRFAWAITVHKSQGMTLDQAEMDLSDCFDSGQAYVALSRLRSLDGMRVLGINEMIGSISRLVRKADFRFRELSEENLEQYRNYQNFKLDQDAYFLKCKQNNWIYVKPRYRARTGYKGSQSVIKASDMREGTKSLADFDKTLKNRDISHTTLINALLKNGDANGVDYSHLRPADNVLDIVSGATKKYALRASSTPLYKNNPMFIMSYIKMAGGSQLSESEVWAAFLFLDEAGNIKK